MILFTLAECPMSYEHLMRWVRVQHPRIVPDAVDEALTVLIRLQFIECRQGRWRISHEA